MMLLDASGMTALASLFGIQAWILWLGAAVAFLILEVSTVNLVSIWFVVGCLMAMVADLLGAGIWVQVQIMVVVSALLLYIFLRMRPHLGITDRQVIATNADRFVGQDALVLEDIDPVAGKGQIKSLGQIWSATSADASRIPAGTLVVITQIRGVRAVVRARENAEGESGSPQKT
ncbi:MAG: NfeD family protein [Clostridia bacterium]|nr:NfeD family protein [Clostridia bacterium]